jgi:DNA-binding transcriptional LysR family regulator
MSVEKNRILVNIRKLMDSNRLKYFIVLNETESVRKAAEILNISPAALSKSIKLLEHEVGTSLIVPSGRGISITAEGRAIAMQVQPLIDGLERIKRTLKDNKSVDQINTKTILIGSFEVFSTHFLDEILNHFPPQASLMLQKIIPGEMEQAILDGLLDYGITYIPIPTTGIVHQKIAYAEMQIFGRVDLFAKTPFKKMPFAIPAYPLSGAPNRIHGLDGWPDGVIDRFIKYRVSMMESALALCRQGRAVAYLPSFVVNQHNKTVKSEYHLKALPFPKGMSLRKQPVFVAKRKSAPNDDIFKKLIHALKSINI